VSVDIPDSPPVTVPPAGAAWPAVGDVIAVVGGGYALVVSVDPMRIVRLGPAEDYRLSVERV